MAQRLEAMEQWGHVRWCVLYWCCIGLVRHVGGSAQAGHMTSFDEVGQQGRLGTTMVYVRCRVLFCLTVWVSSVITWISESCSSDMGEGASVIRHCAPVVFGKGITSRIDSVPAISAAMRSMPKAIPPCGGAP